jgi:6-pyruvoyltetrahydropterin/6-carboxytetrahydropterin synthase
MEKAAKRFRWEGAHRLPHHPGLCRNLHGHSYELWVEAEGHAGDDGMLIDFHEIKRVLGPLVEAWDHATLVGKDDGELLQMLKTLDLKHYVLPGNPTAEAIAGYVARHLERRAGRMMRERGVETIRVRVFETETCYAESAISLGTPSAPRVPDAPRDSWIA